MTPETVRLLKLTPDQIHILQHALGVDAREFHRVPYRDHYVAAVGQDSLDQLVEFGMMTPGRSHPWLAAEHRVYHVTPAGRAIALAALPPLPKLTRAQARYRRYRRVADLMSFREYLSRERDLRSNA